MQQNHYSRLCFEIKADIHRNQKQWQYQHSFPTLKKNARLSSTTEIRWFSTRTVNIQFQMDTTNTLYKMIQIRGVWVIEKYKIPQTTFFTIFPLDNRKTIKLKKTLIRCLKVGGQFHFKVLDLVFSDFHIRILSLRSSAKIKIKQN